MTAIGGGLGIAAMIALAGLEHLKLMAVPFATSIVLVMTAPESLQSQPRNIVGGHLISAISGLAVFTLLGDNPFFAALAVAVAIALMQLTRTLHPPAGINALLMVVAKLPWTFVLMPVLAGSLLLVCFAFLYHRLTIPGQWPISWWTPMRPRDLEQRAISKGEEVFERQSSRK